MAGAEPDEYVLGRSIGAGARLNLQHFLWKKYFGYLIHPRIEIRDRDFKIADIGTGTGIWLIDLADEIPTTVDLYGLDIDISQAPKSGFLPASVQIKELDIMKPIPEDFVGQFDIVNLRLFMLVIKNENFFGILQNIIKMLKPGGWIQWSEALVEQTEYMFSSPNLSTEAMDELRAIVHKTDSRFVPVTWAAKLGEFFKQEGLKQVFCHQIMGQDMPKSWQAFTHETVLLIIQELVEKTEAGYIKDRLSALYPKAAKEARNGASWTCPRILWIGQKPEPEYDVSYQNDF